MGHESIRCGAVPVVLVRLEIDPVAGADRLHRAALALAEPDALGGEDRLAGSTHLAMLGADRGFAETGDFDRGLGDWSRPTTQHRVGAEAVGQLVHRSTASAPRSARRSSTFR